MTDFPGRLREVIPPLVSFRAPMEVVRGEGTVITAADGRRFLDFSTGIACLNLGHNHPRVVEAAREQLDRLWHAGFATYPHRPLVEAAGKIAQVTPRRVEQILFMNSGAEAVEGAVKLARYTRRRPGIIVFRGGFHGRTLGSVAYTTSSAAYRRGYQPLPSGTYVAPFPHPFAWGMGEAEAAERALSGLIRVFRHEIPPEEVAAFLIEPVQGEGGYYPAPPGFLAGLREQADRHGILIIADEVQTGFGRTGDWFAAQTLGWEPDVVVMGKAIANGLPLSAIGASAETFAGWPYGAHGTTYSGNPVACAAAGAVVDELRGVIPGVAERADRARRRFLEMADRYPTVGDVRGLGLMIGVELVDGEGRPDKEAFEAVFQYCFREGLFFLPCGTDGNVIRFIPPLNVSGEHLERALDVIEAGLADYEARR